MKKKTRIIANGDKAFTTKMIFCEPMREKKSRKDLLEVCVGSETVTKTHWKHGEMCALGEEWTIAGRRDA